MRTLRRFLGSIGLSLGSTALAADVVVGNAHLPVPPGWTVASRTSDRTTLKNAEGTQMLTLSSLQFGVSPSFEDFKLLCHHRMEAERRDAPHIEIEEGEPTQTANSFVLVYSGVDKDTGRMFSGQLLVLGTQLTTTYLESIGVDSDEHFESFMKLVHSLRVAGQ